MFEVGTATIYRVFHRLMRMFITLHKHFVR